MLGIILSLLAATGWGLSAVLAMVGLQGVRPALGTLISLVSGFIIVLLVTLAVDREELLSVQPEAIIWFILIGILNFPMGRLFNFQSMSRIGVSKSTTVLASSTLFAMALAVILIGERLTPLIVIGSAFILTGLLIVLTERQQ